ncbi:hypothetical protein OTK49_00895 [Vibrio coralliirubri]|uniref:hypothetical protein n=1 Tax=Vibrio coralliirubri TaxID=1516159 RepID=UPI0022846EEA|nr:hypothetical protein [Vibrio coralliirubri]MCY9861088.1 hypothetical protein [Vibrio coralliirubri]
MKFKFLLCFVAACAPFASASTNTIQQAQVSEVITELKAAILNTNSESITSHIANQIQDTIIATDEAIVFMKMNASNIHISDFEALYRSAMNKSQIQKFERAVLEHGAKSVLASATTQYLDLQNGCDVLVSDYPNGLGQSYRKISVTCMPTIYGVRHWIPVTQKITDTYFISSFRGKPYIEQVEFGLLSKHKKNISVLIKNIEEGIDEQFI